MNTILVAEFFDTNIQGFQNLTIDIPPGESWYARVTGPYPVTWSLVGWLYLRDLAGAEEFLITTNETKLMANRMVFAGRNELLVPKTQMITVDFQPWLLRATLAILSR